MTGRSHLIISTATAVVGASAAGCTVATGTAVIVAAAATAKLPDVDMKIGIRHRGPTHTALACLLVAMLFAFGLSLDGHTAAYSVTVFLGVLTGYGMHLAADACTPRGVPLFAPFSRRDFHLLPRALRITTGSLAEGCVVGTLVVATCLLLYVAYA